MYIVIAIILFGVLIAVHELGHFIAAKLSGVRVLEFAIGMGPKILTFKQGEETAYTLRALPIGGFCAMEGEDVSSDDPRAFTNQKAWKRVIILLAGSAANFLLGALLIAFIVPKLAPSGFQTAEITGFMSGCPYEGENAFLPGDVITVIDGERIHSASDASLFLDWTLGGGSGGVHNITVIRGGETVALKNLRLEKTLPDDNGNENVKYGFIFGRYETGASGAAKVVWYECAGFVRMVRISLAQLITGAAGLRDTSGPVGIVDAINKNAQTVQREQGVSAALIWTVWFGAFIAVNLAVMNLLPIPALDGGRIFFLLVTLIIERFSRRKIDPKYEGYIHGVTYILLLGLMAVVMVNDVLRIIKPS